MVGIDVVSISRFEEMLRRSPALDERLCSRSELHYCYSKPQPGRHLAGTVAAKEAVIKAARLGPLVAWARRIEIGRDAEGVPSVAIDGIPAAIAVSISHDGDVAAAIALMSPGESVLPVDGVTTEFVPER
jgi:holo-[acyl-carrier protein] synthase